jgi:hypothetical protein
MSASYIIFSLFAVLVAFFLQNVLLGYRTRKVLESLVLALALERRSRTLYGFRMHVLL